MVHIRINERTVNPNPHVNFICALPSPGAAYGSDEDFEAKETLRALAAQLKPVMKRHGFTVNSFEEYETNKVFLGRNWNNGETIELVLRDGSDQFYPASRLLGVFCHELAHIKHMNHSAAFHALRRQLSSEVAALQHQGYYGDGYWSAGARLSDSKRILGEGMCAQELPEYTCGGAHAQSRSLALPSRHRRRRRRRPAGPSLTTGAQRAKQRKAGSRVISKTAFEAAGSGNVLDDRVEKGGEGSGFRKQAASRRAREQRALAAERRLMILQGKTPEPPQNELEESETESENDGEDFDRALETDTDRLKRMRDVLGEEDLAAMRDGDDDDIVILSGPGEAHTDSSSARPVSGRGISRPHEESFSGDRNVKRRLAEDDTRDEFPSKKRTRGTGTAPNTLEELSDGPSFPSSLAGPSSLTGGIFKSEIQQRKREALGMDRPRTLGTGASTSKGNEKIEVWACDMCTFVNIPSHKTCLVCEHPRENAERESGVEWSCSKCTFENGALDEKCAMCDHPNE